mmetsp:Transcript_15930/g.34534  ORF Transcript_15930/g.34534 Transcript_15930/m.34534 type:complete len:191 (+) Transcript_15930:68-640(+)
MYSISVGTHAGPVRLAPVISQRVRVSKSLPCSLATSARHIHSARWIQPKTNRTLQNHSYTRGRATSKSLQVVCANADDDKIPPGCRRYQVSLSRPLGLLLEEKKNGEIYVAEIVPDSSAARSGVISVGDILISTSAHVTTSMQVYGETEVPGGEQKVRLNVRGEKFETVMAAIGTHKGALQVELEFQQCE